MSGLAVFGFDLAEACGSSPGYLCKRVFDWTGSEFAADTANAMVKPLKVLLILAVAYVLTRIARRAIRRFVDRLVARYEATSTSLLDNEAGDGERAAWREWAVRRTEFLTDQAERGRQRATTLGAVLGSIAGIIIWTIAIMMALAEFDVSLGPLLAGAGIVGVALGFGAQSLVKDFLSGTFMLIEDQYGVGDIVDVGEAVGVVEAVSLRTTEVRDVNGTLWHVPNGEIRRVGNKSQQWARTVLDVDVAYDTDLDKATAVIKLAADRVWNAGLEHATILEEPEVLGVERFGPDAITLRLVAKVEPSEQFTAARALRAAVKEAFDEAGIVIPFPQRTIWVHEVPNTPDEPETG